MNRKQATRAIRVGSHWMNSEAEVIITKVTKKDVYYRFLKEGAGLADEWWFREHFVPGRLPRKEKP